MSDWQEVKPDNNNLDSTVWDRQGKLIGTLIQVQSNVGPNSSMMYHIQKEDNTVVSVWGTTVLDNKMSAVPVGNMVSIEVTGQAKSKFGKMYPIFTVLTKPAPANPLVSEAIDEATSKEKVDSVFGGNSNIPDMPLGA